MEKAVKLVMPLLQPMDDTVNMHKQTQLQQLAKLNGTEKDPLAAHARFNERLGPDRDYAANVKVRRRRHRRGRKCFFGWWRRAALV